jgi:hypothetical protein
MDHAALYAARRAELLAHERHIQAHQHCPGFDRARYYPLATPRCPHCEPPGSPVRRSQWAAMARRQEPGT